MYSYVIYFISGFIFWACQHTTPEASPDPEPVVQASVLTVGAENMEDYLGLLRMSRVAVVVNHTSRVGSSHLVDTLIKRGIDITKIFAPEHGFRGGADAGAHISDGRDEATGLPIISLYGKSKKPSKEQLDDVDIVLFDIQDVGCRFYTYLSTMHLVMEACAEFNKKIIILDRPNPNGSYVDGPILDTSFRSFVGMHPIPVVHGMTLGELAQMINGEGWLADGQKCDLSVIPVRGWTRKQEYILPIAPSPNLKTQQAIYHYPSLCFFEGTVVSVGRGTEAPFTMIGHPEMKQSSFSFTPQSRSGARSPKHMGELCHGDRMPDLTTEQLAVQGINLNYLYRYYHDLDQPDFFLKNHFIDRLAGTDGLRKSLIAGLTPEQIKRQWIPGIEQFKKDRSAYLIYAD